MIPTTTGQVEGRTVRDNKGIVVGEAILCGGRQHVDGVGIRNGAGVVLR